MSPTRTQQITETVRGYGERLFQFIRSRVGNRDDAEDVLQEVWYQLSSVVDLEQIEQLSGWLYRVARNKIIDRQRKAAGTPAFQWLFEDADGNVRELPVFLEQDTPETELLRKRFFAELTEALSELPAAQRDVFVANELEGFGMEEIAERTGTNRKTLSSRKRYAIQHLRKRLAHWESEFND